MICVLKNKDGLYVQAAMAHLRVDSRTLQATLVPGSKIELQYTTELNKARLVENPDMQAVQEYGLVALVVEASKPELKIVGEILNE